MKVLIVASLFAPWRLGGAEFIAEASARALVNLDHEVHVLTLSPDKSTSQDHQDGYQVRRIPLLNIYSLQEMSNATTLQRIRWHAKDRWNIAMQDAFSKELAMLQPDVVLLHNIAGFSISVYKALSNASVPFVQVLHDHYFCCLYSTMYRKGKSCERKCLRCALVRRKHAEITQLATGVIGVSNFILNRTKALGCFSDVPSQVIHNLASAPSMGDPPNTTSIARSELKCIFGYLGILSESKGVMDLICAFKRSAGPLDRLRLAGNLGNGFEQLQFSINADPRIEYLGVVDRESFFSSIDCLVVPSRWPEPFGLVAQEACFRGVPVLVSNQGALQEAISGAACSYVYDAIDPDGLTAALEAILFDGERRRRQKIVAQSDYKAMEANWIDAYENTLLLALKKYPTKSK